MIVTYETSGILCHLQMLSEAYMIDNQVMTTEASGAHPTGMLSY